MTFINKYISKFELENDLHPGQMSRNFIEIKFEMGESIATLRATAPGPTPQMLTEDAIPIHSNVPRE